MESESKYWADQVAQRIVRRYPRKAGYSLRAGLSASGVVHVGKLREPITVYFVDEALKSKKKLTNFYCYFDDFDRFRKVPSNVPKSWKKYIGMPLCWVPDPWKCHNSYAAHFTEPFLKEMRKLGIKPRYISEAKQYLRLKYKDEIKTALNQRAKLREILDRFREHPLKDDWWPAKVYCETCKKDDTEIVDYDNNYTVTYICNCNKKERRLDFSKRGWIKLLWRVETPMKWKFYDTVFEPWGKDHFTTGGTFDTGKEMIKDIWPYEAPELIAYNWVRLKGEGVKMSSSTGNVITPTELMEIYLVEIVKFLYAGTKPNKEFTLPLDYDFLKMYEDFYFAERVYYGKERVSKRDKQHWRRVYTMCTKPGETMPVQPAIRTCIEFNNIFQNPRTAAERYAKFMKVKKTRRLEQIMVCVSNWLDKYADDKYKFEIQTKPKTAGLKANEKRALRELAKVLGKKMTEKQLFNEFYSIAEKNNLKAGQFFKACYKVIVNRERGPRLAPFILAVGQERIKKLLDKI